MKSKVKVLVILLLITVLVIVAVKIKQRYFKPAEFKVVDLNAPTNEEEAALFALPPDDEFHVGKLAVYRLRETGPMSPTSNIARLEGIDLVTFESLGYGYAKDKNFVYLRTVRFKPDMKTFRLNGWLAIDKNTVYCGAKPIPGSDPETIENVEGNYLKDKNHVYLSCQLVPEADPRTFEVVTKPVEQGFSRDAKNVYRYINKIPDVDPASFEVSDSLRYAKDKNFVYLIDSDYRSPLKKIEGADPKTFTTSIKTVYATDANHVYAWGKIVKDADAKSFVALSLTIGKDSRNIFCRDEILEGVDYSTYEVLSPVLGYARDRNHVYGQNCEIMPNENPATFIPPKTPPDARA